MREDNNQNKMFLNINDELSNETIIYKNIKQNVIIMTEDKARLILIDAEKALKSKRDWGTPLGLFMSLIVTLITSDFRDSFGLSKDTLKAIFIILAILSLGWLLKSLYGLRSNSKKGSVEYIIKQMTDSSN